MRRPQVPVALTIAGSDSGGGAGIQADLKTFASLGVHGTSAITCVTAQNPKEVAAVQACSPKIVLSQIECVFAEMPPAAVKSGMLFAAPIVRAVAGFFAEGKHPPLIVDPVMAATSGGTLLQTSAVKALMDRLLPLAGLVTPNLDEAQVLADHPIKSPEDMRSAARIIHRRFGCSVLVKGGHLRGLRDAVDVFYDGRTELLLAARFVRGVSSHGTGCTYSAAITGFLALGHSLPTAVKLGKEYITQAIAGHLVAAGHDVLNSFWRTRRVSP